MLVSKEHQCDGYRNVCISFLLSTAIVACFSCFFASVKECCTTHRCRVLLKSAVCTSIIATVMICV